MDGWKYLYRKETSHLTNVMFLPDSSKQLMFYTLLLGMLFQLKYYFLGPVNMAVWSTCLSMCDVLGSIPSTVKNSGITIRYRIKCLLWIRAPFQECAYTRITYNSKHSIYTLKLEIILSFI